MDFTDSPEQAALRATVRAFLGQHATPARVRAAMADPAGHDVPTWKRLTGELGLVALAVPERYDGAGASLAEVAIVAEELGRVLLPAPYLSTALVAALLGEQEALGAAADLLPALAAGSMIGAFALASDVTARHRADGWQVGGAVRHVVDGPQADLFVVRAGEVLLAVRASDATVTPVGTLDQTRGQATVSFTAAPALLISTDPAVARRAEDVVRMALAAESVGAADRCLATAVEHLKTRVQFGKPIGSFQALKHRCADLAVAVESARATARFAAWTAVADPEEFAVVAPLAKLYCVGAFLQVAAESIQLHGGIGFTWEHEAHLYLKRAKSSELLCGAPGELRRLVGRRAGLLS